MSDTDAKIKRSKRLHKDEAAAHRQAKIARSHGIEVKEENRYNKHHALDCGNPDCGLCGNPRHRYKEETIQEKSFKQRKLHDEE